MSGTINYEKIKRTTVNRHYRRWGKEKADIIQGSRYAWLVDELTESALDYAKENDMDFDAYCELLERTFPIAEGFRYSLSPEMPHLEASERESFSDSDVETYHAIWEYTSFLFGDIKENRTPQLMWHQLSENVSGYLDMPFRCAAVDRWLVQALIASKLILQGNQLIHGDCIFNDPPLTPLNTKHPVRNYLSKSLFIAIPLFGGAGLSIFAGFKQWVADVWSIAVAIILVVIFMALAVRSLIFLPSEWRLYTSGMRRARQHLEEMNFAYDELYNPYAPISAPHIIRVLEKNQDKGVSWPPSLFVLLEDISKRSGTF